MSHSWKRASRALLCLVASYCFASPSAIAESHFTYDAQGRLQTTTDASGVTAEYVYDSVGNLLEVRRLVTDQLAITAFAPASGPAGTAVTVNGSGFSAPPESNQVSFNGTPGVVTAASATALSVTVPSGASTGRIGVSVGTQTVQSASDFVVTADDGRPTIAAFTPGCARPDDTVAVTGTNFDPRPDATRVEVGGRIARAVVASPTALTLTVPRFTAGGKIRVITPAGTAESTQTLMAYAGLPCSSVATSFWIDLDGSPATATLPQGKSVLVYFAGRRGQWLSFQGSGLTPATGAVSASLLNPDGTATTGSTTFASYNGYSFHMPPLSQDGVHAVLLSSGAVASLTLRLVSTPVVTADGAAGHLLSAEAGQSQRVALTGDMGAALGVAINAMSPASGANTTWSLYRPDGSVLASLGTANLYCNAYAPVCHLNVPPLPEEGYAILLWSPPRTSESQSATLWLSNDVQADLTPPSASFPISITRYGRNARLRFQGEAGRGMSLSLAGLQLSGGSALLGVHLYDPNGQLLAGGSQITRTTVTGSGAMVTMPNLPMSGMYTVLLDPGSGGFANLEATLDPGVPLPIDGSAVQFASNKTGRGFRAVIDGVAGQSLGIGVMNIVSAVYSQTTINVYLPDGTLFPGGTFNCMPKSTSYPGCELDLGPLPFTGRYALTIEPPPSASSASLEVLASNDLVASLTGSQQNINITRDGGNARLTFEGVPGAGQTIEISDFVTTPTGQAVGITVLRPDGEPLNLCGNAPLYNYLNQVGTSGRIQIGDFPVRGTYRVFVDPANAARTSFNARITAGVDVTEGQITTHKSVVPGPWKRGGFTGSVGDRKAVGVGPFGTTSNLCLSVYDPDGRALIQTNPLSRYTSCSTAVGYCDFDLPPLTQAGSYQVVVDVLSAKPEDVTAPITVSDDLVVTGNSGAFDLLAGRNGRLVFNAFANQTVSMTLTRSSATATNRTITVTLFGPAGNPMGVFAMPGTSSSYGPVSLGTLPISGNYTLLIDPEYGFPTTLGATIQ